MKSFEEYKNYAIGKDGSIHFVYIIRDSLDKTYYIGKHHSSKHNADLVAETFVYGTSSFKRKDIIFYKKARFRIKILKIFDNNFEASLYEAYLHKKRNVSENPRYWNLGQAGIPHGFRFYHNKGLVGVMDKETGESIRVSTEEFRNNRSKYKHHSEGMVTVREKESGKNMNVTREEFYKNKDKYFANNCNKKMFYDEKLKRNRFIREDEKDLLEDPKRFSTLKSDAKNNMNVYDKNGTLIRISTEDYYKNKDKYFTHSSGKVYAIMAESGEKVCVTIEEFKELKAAGKIRVRTDFSKHKMLVLDKDTNEEIRIERWAQKENPARYKIIRKKYNLKNKENK